MAFAGRLQVEDSMEARIARLETHCDRIQSDMQELRRDVRGLGEELKNLQERFDAKLGGLQRTLESIQLGRVWDRVWTLLSMGALLAVMARGFQWI